VARRATTMLTRVHSTCIPRCLTPSHDIVQRPAKRIRPSDPSDEGNTLPGGWICTPNRALDFICGTDSTLLQHPLPWLKELHSKIWNREDLKPTLFRKVEVTRAHYDALQDRLNRKYPDRDFEHHNDRCHDVLSDKLDILKLTTPAEALSPRHPDNNEDRMDNDDDLEASNEDDSVINSFLPSTLSYLESVNSRAQERVAPHPFATFHSSRVRSYLGADQ
jgi:hypothetical protein